MAEVVYDFAVRSLLLGIGEGLTPQLSAKLKALGVDAHARPEATYSRETWGEVVELVSQETKRSHRQLGAQVTDGFTRTPLGGLMTPAVRLMGVRRMLELLPHTFTMTNNFMRVRLERASDESVLVRLSHDAPSADFLCGSIEQMARYAGATECLATARREDGALLIEARWR
jgi:uncharacterized protein (TIGR02265 family)